MDYRVLFAGAGAIAVLIGRVKTFLNAKSTESGDSVTSSVLTRINNEYNDTRH